MAQLSMILEFLLVSILAGVVGTSGMTLLLYLITRTGVTNANMVVAIGSILTKTRKNAARVGFIIHYTSGTVFGILYTIIFRISSVHGFLPTTGIGLGFGFIHGFVISFIIVIAVAEHHPLEEFREAGFAVALAHILGHLVYGTLVGAVIGFSGILS